MTYGKSKVRRAQKQLVEQACLGVNPHALLPYSTEISECTKLCKYLVVVMDLKTAISMRQKKLQFITLAPPSWTMEQTQGHVGVSAYFVKKLVF